MGNLKLQFVYLCGPIDDAEDLGAAWRDWITPKLAKMGIVVLNPCKKPTDRGSEEKELHERRDVLFDEKSYDEITAIMSEVRAVDLHMLDLSTFFIVYLDMSKKMCGTWEEISLANAQRKPVLVVCPQGKEHISPWLFAELDHRLFFDTFPQLLEYLEYMDTTDQKTQPFEETRYWRFFDIEDQVRAALGIE